MPTKGADEYVVAELKNDVMAVASQRFLSGRTTSRRFLPCRSPAATALKLAGVSVKDAVRTNFGLSRQTLWTGLSKRTPSPDLAREALRGDGEQVQERSRWQDSL